MQTVPADNVGNAFKESLIIVLHIIYEVQTLVVQGSDSIFRIILSPKVVNFEQRVHKCLLINGILRILGNQTTDKCCSVDEHILICGRRANAVRLTPIRKCVIIILLLVVLLVIGKILDAVCTVGTIFTLSRQSGSRPSDQDCQKNEQYFFHIYNF